ncbi:hypothetical protein HDV02_002276 [Globomyces sp. JEL0801]|nr:hypothetical protein HDV02_002276 [Globomyces sp. JEL0801]
MADEDMNLTEQIKQLTDSTIESFITEAFKVSEKSTSQMYQIHLDGVHQQSKWQFKSITSDVEISLKCPETSNESNRQIWGARGKKFIQHTPKSIFDTVKSVTDHTPHLDPLFKNGKVVKTIFSEQNEIGEEIDAAEVSLLRYTMGIPLVSDRVFLYLERRKKVQVQILAEDGSISTKNAYVVVLNSLEDDELEGTSIMTAIHPLESHLLNSNVHNTNRHVDFDDHLNVHLIDTKTIHTTSKYNARIPKLSPMKSNFHESLAPIEESEEELSDSLSQLEPKKDDIHEDEKILDSEHLELENKMVGAEKRISPIIESSSANESSKLPAMKVNETNITSNEMKPSLASMEDTSVVRRQATVLQVENLLVGVPEEEEKEFNHTDVKIDKQTEESKQTRDSVKFEKAFDNAKVESLSKSVDKEIENLNKTGRIKRKPVKYSIELDPKSQQLQVETIEVPSPVSPADLPAEAVAKRSLALVTPPPPLPPRELTYIPVSIPARIDSRLSPAAHQSQQQRTDPNLLGTFHLLEEELEISETNLIESINRENTGNDSFNATSDEKKIERMSHVGFSHDDEVELRRKSKRDEQRQNINDLISSFDLVTQGMNDLTDEESIEDAKRDDYVFSETEPVNDTYPNTEETSRRVSLLMSFVNLSTSDEDQHSYRYSATNEHTYREETNSNSSTNDHIVDETKLSNIKPLDNSFDFSMEPALTTQERVIRQFDESSEESESTRRQLSRKRISRGRSSLRSSMYSIARSDNDKQERNFVDESGYLHPLPIDSNSVISYQQPSEYDPSMFNSTISRDSLSYAHFTPEIRATADESLSRSYSELSYYMGTGERENRYSQQGSRLSNVVDYSFTAELSDNQKVESSGIVLERKDVDYYEEYNTEVDTESKSVRQSSGKLTSEKLVSEDVEYMNDADNESDSAAPGSGSSELNSSKLQSSELGREILRKRKSRGRLSIHQSSLIERVSMSKERADKKDHSTNSESSNERASLRKRQSRGRLSHSLSRRLSLKIDPNVENYVQHSDTSDPLLDAQRISLKDTGDDKPRQRSSIQRASTFTARNRESLREVTLSRTSSVRSGKSLQGIINIDLIVENFDEIVSEAIRFSKSETLPRTPVDTQESPVKYLPRSSSLHPVAILPRDASLDLARDSSLELQDRPIVEYNNQSTWDPQVNEKRVEDVQYPYEPDPTQTYGYQGQQYNNQQYHHPDAPYTNQPYNSLSHKYSKFEYPQSPFSQAFKSTINNQQPHYNEPYSNLYHQPNHNVYNQQYEQTQAHTWNAQNQMNPYASQYYMPNAPDVNYHSHPHYPHHYGYQRNAHNHPSQAPHIAYTQPIQSPNYSPYSPQYSPYGFNSGSSSQPPSLNYQSPSMQPAATADVIYNDEQPPITFHVKENLPVSPRSPHDIQLPAVAAQSPRTTMMNQESGVQVPSRTSSKHYSKDMKIPSRASSKPAVKYASRIETNQPTLNVNMNTNSPITNELQLCSTSAVQIASKAQNNNIAVQLISACVGGDDPSKLGQKRCQKCGLVIQ